jgi:hypothetical protein
MIFFLLQKQFWLYVWIILESKSFQDRNHFLRIVGMNGDPYIHVASGGDVAVIIDRICPDQQIADVMLFQ